MGEARRRELLGMSERTRGNRVRDKDFPRGYVFVKSDLMCEVCGQLIAANSKGQYTRFCSGQCRKRRYRLP